LLGLLEEEGVALGMVTVTEGLPVAATELEEPPEVTVAEGATEEVALPAGSGMAAFLMVKRAEYDWSGVLVTRMEYWEPEATVVGTLTVKEPALEQSRSPREGTPATGIWTPSARWIWSMTGKTVVVPLQVLVQETVAS
jgi:hypothetical protein